MEVHDQRAVEVLVKGGATADGVRVRIPEFMVARALESAPKRMTLYDRHGRAAMRATGFNTFFGGGSDCLYVLDHRTGKRRRARSDDVCQAVTLMDALPNIDFVMSAFLPEDVDQRIYDRYQMEIMLSHSTKPIVYVTPDLEGCVAAVEMCEAVAGGAEAFQRRPFAACYINVTSGLTANAEALQKCIFLAEKGLPQLYIPLNAGGVNSPTTTAGCLAAMNAGTLLGIVLSQLVRPGTMIAVPGWNGGPYNLKTMVGNYVLAEEQGVATEMGKHYDLPVFGLGGCTDSKVLDQQCGMEVTISLMTALLHGANIVHDVGFMDSGMQGSLQVMAIAHDTIGWLRAATLGVVVNDNVGAGRDRRVGTNRELPGTRTHHAPLSGAVLFPTRRQGHLSQWTARGGTTMEARAAKLVDEILAQHAPEPLPAHLKRLSRRSWSESRHGLTADP